MSIVLQGSTSGSVTLQEPAVAGTTVLTLPTTSGTVLTSASSVTRSQLPVGSVLQVKQYQLTSTASTSTNSMTDTGISVTITPTASTSQFLLVFTGFLGVSTVTTTAAFNFVRNGTAIGLSTAASGSGVNFGIATGGFNSSHGTNVTMQFLDSPSTASAITYKVQWMAQSSQTFYLNYSPASYNANGDTYAGSFTSALTVYEVAA
jgi:hypothetical protein